MKMTNEVMIELLQEVKAIAEHVKQVSNNSNDPLWMDNVEVMEYLHVSAKTLHRFRELGLLKYSKVRGKLFYRRSDIHLMLEQHEVPFSTTKIK